MTTDRSKFLCGHLTVDGFSQYALKQILLSTKSSNSLPNEEKDDWDFYKTYSGFRDVMRVERRKILDLIRRFLQYHGVKRSLSEETDKDDLCDVVTDVNDHLLERVRTKIDEETRRRNQSENGPTISLKVTSRDLISVSHNSKNRVVSLLSSKNILRPQLEFKDRIDNSDTPFVPKLKEKPNSLKPLSILKEYAMDGSIFYSQPYAFEIDHLLDSDFSPEMGVPVKPKGLSEIPVQMVNDERGLLEMISHLRQQKTICVDLEHHSYRTYLGLTCLVQISTPDTDYIVDPFPIWDSMTYLNEVFTDTKVTKVLHGADRDVEWLQRDFSVYIVNMFDTHLAARYLGLPRFSLAFLLNHYLGHTVDKQYQLADWRIRPLPAEMVRYAREDTHYLFYIYNMMKNELISRGNEDNNLLRQVVEQSNFLCRKRYEKPRPELELESTFGRLKENLNNRQRRALADLFYWRDKVARAEDESTSYVIPNHMLQKIAIELPREMQGIIACCNPIPPLVKQNLQEMHQSILVARETPLVSMAGIDAFDRNAGILQSPFLGGKGEDDFHYNFLHDFPSSVDRDSVALPTVLSEEEEVVVSVASPLSLKERPQVSVFATSDRLSDEGSTTSRTSSSVTSGESFISPFQRYLLLLPFLKNQESDNKEEQQAARDIDTQLQEAKKRSYNSDRPPVLPAVEPEAPRRNGGSTTIPVRQHPKKSKKGEVLIDPSKVAKLKNKQRRRELRRREAADGKMRDSAAGQEVSRDDTPPAARKEAPVADSARAALASTSSYKSFNYDEADYTCFSSKKKEKKRRRGNNNKRRNDAGKKNE